LTKSIQHWSAQNLTVFGRVNAARSYLGGQAWFLANMVPPISASLKRFTALLWAFVQNNSILGDSNHHYSPWSRQTLIQKRSAGGLTAQDFEFHLSALHAKWIFKLLDTRHVASWKSLPFHFFRQSFIPGVGDSAFIMDASFSKCADQIPARWKAFLKAWFDTRVIVAPPPLDFECILNEPIWFNRFLYLKSDPTHGRLPTKAREVCLFNKGFNHLLDLLPSSHDAGSLYNPWLSKEEAVVRTGSTRLANSLLSIIDLIPIEWSKIVWKKQREPFLCGD
jgi:hypothetical protein